MAYREVQRSAHPDWFNAPVPTFGDPATAQLLVVGLAPGVAGANRTGRPFTGDYAGDLLYSALLAHGFAEGTFAARADDGLILKSAAITNAVRCVPPKNKPLGAEIANCRPFLVRTIEIAEHLKIVLALGRIAHDAVIRALGSKLVAHPFAHGAMHEVGSVAVADSYHPSRYNVNTGVLTAQSFDDVMLVIRHRLG